MNSKLAKQTAGLFLLGGGQGLMGWFMVMSGLADQPEVSHFRLAAHLALALLIAQLCLWLLLGERPKKVAAPWLRRFALAFLALVSLQVVYGAFMAGLRAGFLSATFPMMNGQWVPDAALTGSFLHDIVSNPYMVHFLHRTLGWVVLGAALALGAALLKAGFKKPANILMGMVGVQFTLGVMTVMMHVAIPVAVIHQVGGAILLSVAVYVLHATSRVTSD